MTEMLQTLYRDAHYVAIDKPSGLLVHRSPIDRHETEFCVQRLREQIGAWVYPCHRLDKPTSGILLFALDKEALGRANTAFAQRRVRKHYAAIVRGWIQEAGRLDYPLRREQDKGQDVAPQEAVTHYRPLELFELPYPSAGHSTSRFSLLELSPETGRRHQLRRHLKHLSHPIIGDTQHGDRRQNSLFREHFDCHRLLLAATALRLDHPMTGAPLAIDCAVSGRFHETLRSLRSHHHGPAAV